MTLNWPSLVLAVRLVSLVSTEQCLHGSISGCFHDLKLNNVFLHFFEIRILEILQIRGSTSGRHCIQAHIARHISSSFHVGVRMSRHVLTKNQILDLKFNPI